MINILLFGPPGSGKGTQAEVISKEFGLVHISTGDVFRENIKQATFLGLKVKSILDNGELVPDQITIDMLKLEIEKHNRIKGFIFDGFPRTLFQLEALENILREKKQNILAMIALAVEKQELVKRLMARAKLSGRSDDSDETIINNRIKVYNSQTSVVSEYFKNRDKYIEIQGNQFVEKVSSDIIRHIKDFLIR